MNGNDKALDDIEDADNQVGEAVDPQHDAPIEDFQEED